MFARTVNPSRKGCANLRTGKSDIVHAERRSVIVGEDEGWMKSATGGRGAEGWKENVSRQKEG